MVKYLCPKEIQWQGREQAEGLRKVAQKAAGTGSGAQTQSHLIIFLRVVARTL